MDDFYALWLKIPAGKRPPDHYALLRLPRFSADLHQIEAAAQQQLELLDRYAIHPDPKKRDACNELMGEVARARIVLSNPEKRAAYDATLGARPTVSVSPERPAVARRAKPNALQRFLQRPMSWHAAWAVPAGCVLGALVIWLAIGPGQKTAGEKNVAVAIAPVAKPKPPQPSIPVTPAPAVPEDKSPPTTPAANEAAPAGGSGLFSMEKPMPAPRPVQSAGNQSPPARSASSKTPGASTPTGPVAALVPKKTPAESPRPAAPPAGTLLPIPDPGARAVAGKLVDDIYARDIKAATTPEEKAAVAQKMIDMAANLRDDPRGQYVLLDRARDFAVHAGDVQMAFAALSAMSKGFQIDGLEIKADILKAVAPSISPAQGCQFFIDQTNSVFDDALAADRFEVANTAANSAMIAANKLHDRSLRDQMESRLQRVKILQAEFAKLAEMRSRLAKNPADPDANTQVGKYFCFDKGDWKVGLPMLAIGSEKTTRQLAVTELSHPSDTAEVLKLADGWWELSDSAGTTRRLRVMRHSSAIYSRIAPKLEGLLLAEARKRIEATELAGARPVNLMPLIDVARDAVRGHWKMQGNGLLAYGENGMDDAFRELRIRYQVPEEYDFRVSFLAADKRIFVSMLLSHADHVFAFDMGQSGFTNYTSMYAIDNPGKGRQNSTAVDGPVLEANSSHSAVVKVRKDWIGCYLDGVQITELKTDFANVNMLKDTRNSAQYIGNGLGLGGACYNAMGPTLFTKLEVVEIVPEDPEQ